MDLENGIKSLRENFNRLARNENEKVGLREEVNRSNYLRVAKNAFEAARDNPPALNYFREQFAELEERMDSGAITDSDEIEDYISEFLGDYYYELNPETLQVKDLQAENYNNESNLNEEEIAGYDLNFGHLGSGTVVWDSNREEAGDYKKVAHISETGDIKYYEEVPPEVAAAIEAKAKNPKWMHEEDESNLNEEDNKPENLNRTFNKISWARKPSEWKDVDERISYESMSDEEKAGIDYLTKKQNYKPIKLDNPFDYFEEQGITEPVDQFAIVQDPAGNYYLLDTQGYEYPRYLTKLENYSMNEYDSFFENKKLVQVVERIIEKKLEKRKKLNEFDYEEQWNSKIAYKSPKEWTEVPGFGPITKKEQFGKYWVVQAGDYLMILKKDSNEWVIEYDNETYNYPTR